MKKMIALVFISFLFNSIIMADVPVLSSDSFCELYGLTEDYCQYKISCSDPFEKEFFSFILSRIRETQSISIAADFITGNVWFIEPQAGFYIMTAPKYYQVTDHDLCCKVASIITAVGNSVFLQKNKLYTPVAGEISVSMNCLTDPCCPRNEISLKVMIKNASDSDDDFKLSEFSGKAHILD